ncbi:hypothetical protein PHPALM_28904 [Phytophthora palmivora]|uniref:Uncharacterized protein n=1 Tax=Phytophthora palmivora TaxID=4796 RepID=A0A2P4X8X2_9STRA|nr:hypothetical protein PHPALM_28904 [Phytophthora palmivora]
MLDVAKPGFDAPFVEWTKVTSRISLSNPKIGKSDSEYQIPEVHEHDGRVIFEIPCTPARHEIAIDDPDAEDKAEDTDIQVYVDNLTVSSTPLRPTLEVGELIAAHSLLDVPRTKMQRSRLMVPLHVTPLHLKQKATHALTSFEQLNEPESRLAAITVQPHVFQTSVTDATPLLETTVSEHVMFRAYSGFPSTHGTENATSTDGENRLTDRHPSSKCVLERLFPKPDTRDKLTYIWESMPLKVTMILSKLEHSLGFRNQNVCNTRRSFSGRMKYFTHSEMVNSVNTTIHIYLTT